MSSHGEQIERQAFVQASIDATHETLTDENVKPHLVERLGEEDWAYHEQLTRRMFPAESPKTVSKPMISLFLQLRQAKRHAFPLTSLAFHR